MISFEKYTGHENKRTAQLKKQLFLLRFIGSKSWVKLGKILFQIAIKSHIPIQWLYKTQIFK